MADRKVKGSSDVLRLVEDKNRFLTSILIGNTVALLAADSLATTIAIDMGLPNPAIWSTAVMSVVLLLFGEIIPKTLAAGHGDRWALGLARYTLLLTLLISESVVSRSKMFKSRPMAYAIITAQQARNNWTAIPTLSRNITSLRTDEGKNGASGTIIPAKKP